MSIEVTDADVEAVEDAVERVSKYWDCINPKRIIAAAWAVLEKKLDSKDEDLAVQVKRAMLSSLYGSKSVQFHSTTGGCLVSVSIEGRMLISLTLALDDEFAHNATDRVREMSAKIDQAMFANAMVGKQ